jgi:TetR/AcrR family transcriptional repressor of nem operon
MSRYEKGRKEETHRRVVEVAAERFRSSGIDSVGVASLMADAGLTHGGFYAHFASKEALVKEATTFALESSARLVSSGQEATPRLDLPSFIAAYLSPEHRDGPATGCALAALAPEIGRRPKPTRNAFAKETRRMIARVASGLPGSASPESSIATAYAVVAQMMGSLQLSRIVTDKKASDSLLSAGRTNALKIAGLSPAKDAEAKRVKGKVKKH